MGDLRGGDPQKSDFWGELGVTGGVMMGMSAGMLRAAGALRCLAICNTGGVAFDCVALVQKSLCSA